MPFLDKRQNRNTVKQQRGAGSLLLPDRNQQVEQVSFPDPFTPPPTGPLVSRTSSEPLPQSPATTGQLTDYTVVTRDLPVVQTGPMLRTTTSLRQPTVIRGTGKKSAGITRPPKGRRLVMHIAASCLLLLIILGTLIAVVPTSSEGHSGFNILQSYINFVHSKTNNTDLIAQQAATVTAVTQDGYDPGGGQFYAGLPSGPHGNAGSLNTFFYGQCTYWANMRYHGLTGHWVSWLGDAWQWTYGAQHSGWVVSATPHMYSIIVLQPGVQQAGPYGHVAVVERINPDGSVSTSNWNWGGAWGRETFQTFTPGPGAAFVWYPGT